MNGTPQGSTDHPVWDVYNELRTARLNVIYIQSEVKALRHADRFTEILIAIATTSSVGSFWFFQNSVGQSFWKTMGAIAVVLSIVRPILRLPQQLQTKEKLLVNYTVLAHDLKCIGFDVRRKQTYDNMAYKDFLKAMDRKAELLKASAQSLINERLRKRCEELVTQELPTSSFYIPNS